MAGKGGRAARAKPEGRPCAEIDPAGPFLSWDSVTVGLRGISSKYLFMYSLRININIRTYTYKIK